MDTKTEVLRQRLEARRTKKGDMALADVSASDLRGWLETRGFGAFAATFEAEHVCGGDLSDSHFSIDDLVHFGVGTPEDQRALFNAIKGLDGGVKVPIAVAKETKKQPKKKKKTQSAARVVPETAAMLAAANDDDHHEKTMPPSLIARIVAWMSPRSSHFGVRKQVRKQLRRHSVNGRAQRNAGAVVVRGTVGEWDGFSGVYRICTERFAAGPFGSVAAEQHQLRGFEIPSSPKRGGVWTKSLGPGGVQFWQLGAHVQVFIYRHANGHWYMASSKEMMVRGEGGHFRSVVATSDAPVGLQWQRQHDEDGDGRWDTGDAVWSIDDTITVRPVRVGVTAQTAVLSEKSGKVLTMAQLDAIVAKEIGTSCPLVKVDLTHGGVAVLRPLEFKANSATPADEALFDDVLRQIARVVISANSHLPDVADLHFIVAGHADVPEEKALANWCVSLTQQRADAVKEHLLHMGVDDEHLHPRGYGGSQPLRGVVVGEGARPNMRVEFRATNAARWPALVAQPLSYDTQWQLAQQKER